MKETGKISFWTAVLMSMNIIIGGGIFAGPQNITFIAGSLGFLSWVLAALLVFPIVWGISLAPTLFPGPGGFYHYCKSGLNENFGFLAHWVFLLGYVMGTTAALTLLLREAMANRLGIYWMAEHPYLSNALILATFSLLNLLPVGFVSKLQAGTTLLKLLPLIIILGLVTFYINPNIEYNLSQISQLPLTIPSVIFGYLGFEICCSLSHLLKDGPSSVSKVVLTAFFITAILYMIFHFGLLQIMGTEALAKEGAIAFPSYLGWSAQWTTILSIVVGGAILISFANSVFGLSLGNITNIVAISQGSQFKAALIHGLVIWLQLCFISDINTIFAFTVVGIGSTYFLTVIAVLRHSLKTGHRTQSFLMVLGCFSCLILFYTCWISLGGSIGSRLLNLSPIFLGIALGYLLNKKKLLKVGY